MSRTIATLMLAAVCASAQANEAAPPVAGTIKDTKNPAFGANDNFGAFEDNYILLANRMRNNGWAGADERAMRAHYSLRYVLFGRREDTCQTRQTDCTTFEVFLAYTGEFDFYLNTRPSGPVINRLSNPGLHVRWRPSTLFTGKTDGDFVSAGFEHASDGQVSEVHGADALLAQRNYDERQRPYFDEISRGSNFVAIGARVVDVYEDFPLVVSGKLRAYVNQDSDVTWGPLAGRGVRLSDYHRVSLAVERTQPGLGTFEARWTVGDKGLATDSFDFGWRYKLQWADKLTLPLYLRVHRGPLNTLSNYTQRQDSIGFGLRFANF